MTGRLSCWLRGHPWGPWSRSCWVNPLGWGYWVRRCEQCNARQSKRAW